MAAYVAIPIEPEAPAVGMAWPSTWPASTSSQALSELADALVTDAALAEASG